MYSSRKWCPAHARTIMSSGPAKMCAWCRYQTFSERRLDLHPVRLQRLPACLQGLPLQMSI